MAKSKLGFYPEGLGAAAEGGPGSGRVAKLEAGRASGKVLKTTTGYKATGKHGTTHYDKQGNITRFEPKTTAHEQRFAPKKDGK